MSPSPEKEVSFSSGLAPTVDRDEKRGSPIPTSSSNASDFLTLQGAEEDRHSRSSSPPRQPRSLFASICIVSVCTSTMIMSIAMGAAISITLPATGNDLNIPRSDLQWIVNAFSISSACFLLPCGRLADLYGRKRVWIVGYLITAAFGLAAGFAQSGIALDVLRGFQGIGAAATIPASLGILAQSFPPSYARSVAFATFAAGAPMGGACGNIVGGVLTQVTKPTWRSSYYLLSGISLACTALGYLCIDGDEPSAEEDQRVDWIGAFLVTIGLILIVFVLSDSPTAPRGWRNPYIIALLIVGVLFLALFIAWQHYLERRQLNPNAPRTRWTAPPLMKPSMWTRARGRFAVMQMIACMNWAGFTCWLVFVQLYYQTYRGFTPIQTMLRFLPNSITGIIANIILALIVGRVDVVYIVATGTLLTGCANLLFAVINPSASYWAFGFPSATLVVLGADFTFASGTLFVSKIVLPHEQSVGGAVFQAMTLIGSAIGLSVSNIVFNSVLRTQSQHLGIILDKDGDNAPLPAQLKAYRATMWTGFAFGITCTALSIFLRGVGVVGHKDEKVSPEPEAHESRYEKKGGLDCVTEL